MNQRCFRVFLFFTASLLFRVRIVPCQKTAQSSMASTPSRASSQHQNMKDITDEDDTREPFYIYLQNTELNARVQKYISAFVQHIASILEKDEPQVRRIVSFLPERNGNRIFFYETMQCNVILFSNVVLSFHAL